MIGKSSNVPIYGSWDFYLGKGIIGGVLTRGVDQGQGAARMALSILGGKSPSSIPIELNNITVPMFDYQQLEKYYISSKQLPANSVIINKPPLLIVRYAKYALAFVCLLIMISLIMGIRLLVVRRRNKRLVEMTKELDCKVKERTRQLEMEKTKLEETLTQVKTLQGLLPICASCKNIRDDKGYWNQIEGYISKHTDAVFSHGICPDCAKKLYPELFDEHDSE